MTQTLASEPFVSAPITAGTAALWDAHYMRNRAAQKYPDENLVRLLHGVKPGPAFDLGSGSGRHIKLLREMEFSPVVAADVSRTSVALCRRQYPDTRVMQLSESDFLDSTFQFPLAGEFFQVITAWGVLHYNEPRAIEIILKEVRRMLRPGGHFLGTLRAVGDSHLVQNPDLPDVAARYFSETEARSLIASAFDNVELGYAERSPVGRLDKRVCHWIFRAIKA